MKEMVSHLLLVLIGSTASDAALSEDVLYGDANVMADVLAFLAALLTEADPAATTNQSLRHGAEEMTRRVTIYAKAIRAENERTGTRLISQFSGADDVIAKPDRTN
jgi:hypothetical protein